MSNFIQPLLQLQTLESAVLDIKKQREMCAVTLEALRGRMRNAEEALTVAEGALASKKCSYQTQELELKRLENLLSQQKAKRPLIKKTEALNALEEASHRYAQQISDLQDQMLLQLEEIDTQKKCIQEQKKAYEVQKAQWNVQISEFEQKNNALGEQLEEAQKQQAAYESNLKNAYYSAYVNLRKCGKPMPRIVPIREEEKCGGCFLALSRETIDCLQREGMQFCEHCGRILYKLDYD